MQDTKATVCQIQTEEDGKRIKEAAMNYFLDGYNCAQSVLLAFSDYLPIPKTELMKLACSFGGGMGRLREVCGTVSAMFMVAGLIYGYDTPEIGEIKAAHYARIQDLAHRFELAQGSIVCRELLGLTVKHDVPQPEARTEQYYKKRPCKELIGYAAELLSEYIRENPV